VIIGPTDIYQDRFLSAPNLFFPGPVNHEDLPPYLQYADIGIIPFNKEKYPSLVNSISPIKLLEYMACGLPVISTKWNEIAAINSPAWLCNTHQDFRTSIEKIASSGPIHKQDLQKYAAENDWSFRYQELIRMIDL
jgi:glycosyltransferase involved in cell wall biosynthesis